MTDGTKEKVTDRRRYAELAKENMDEPKYDAPGPTKISTPELVRTIRQTEEVVADSLEENKVNADFCQGFFAAMAAIRHDFGINDTGHVSTKRETRDD